MISKSDTLNMRSGLPDDLRYLLEKYPRGDWQGHENLGAMAQFWLQRHDMFRDLGTVLNTSIDDYREGRMEAQAFAQFFIPRIEFFLQQLHGHHQIEDTHYFPIFQKAEKRLAHGFDLLDSDHHIIHAALDANAQSANAMLKMLPAGRDASLRAADAYSDNTASLVGLLMRHLHDEEDLIIPLILDRTEAALGVA